MENLSTLLLPSGQSLSSAAQSFLNASFYPVIPFFPFEKHLLLFPSTTWENLWTLLLPSGLSLSSPSSQSFLNASFYPVYSSFWNLIPFSLPARPGSRTILSTIDSSKAFDSVWHPALFHKLISAGQPFCFARWTQSFLSDRRACVVYQNYKSRSFRIRQGVPQGSVLGPLVISLFINDLPVSLPSSVSCSLYADDLAIWSPSPSVPIAVEASQGALIRLERWSEYWCLPLNPSKCETCFFSVDLHQAHLQPNLLLLGCRLRFNPTSTFLGVTFDHTLSFTEHYLR